MHIIKSEHDLTNYVGCLTLRKAIKLRQTIKQLTAFDNLWDNIIIFIVFDQINYPNNIRMRLLAEDLQLIL